MPSFVRSRFAVVALGVPLALATLMPAPAHAQRYGYHGGYYRHGFGGVGVAGAILGLGVGAAIAGAYAPRYYGPTPYYYAPPPVVYAPPPVVYGAPPVAYAPY
jgi:hypothetical protein